MRVRLVVPAVGLMLLAALSCPVAAQDAEPAPEAPAEAAPPRKPKPKPRPKPQAKPVEKPAETPAEPKAAAGGPTEAAAPNPGLPLAPAPSAATLSPAPPVACEKGEAVRYEASAGKAGAPAVELWVTRSGSITIDNPLRPLTPDVTRVLQVVIGGKVATAYGPDLQSLRRGAGPTVLEGVIGGAVRWDASLVTLPDTLPILSDSGDVLAAFTFRACGTAPAARTLAAPKPRRTAPPADAALTPETGKASAKDASGDRSRPARRAEPRPDSAPRPPAVPLPQGAIP